MAWILLILAGLSEIVMAYFLKLSDGFSQLWPSIGFLVAGALSFFLLAYTLKWLPVGTAYAVWTGIGAVGTAIVGMIFLGESRDVARLVSIALIIAGVVGLQLSSSGGH